MELNEPAIRCVCDIARQAGTAIMQIYGQDDFAVAYKDDHSPLTAADKASHQVIVSALAEHFPGIPILSEEGADIPYESRRQWTQFWLVDPLDGTKEFIKRNGEFTVNIALIKEGVPMLGVVYVPAQGILYCGCVGRGATCSINDEPPREIHVRELPLDHGLRVVVSRSHPSAELEDYLSTLKIDRLVPVGSSLKLCVVAEGNADLYPRLGPTMEWDTAAGHAVVVAAGGSVVTPQGTPLLYNKQKLLNPYFIVSSAAH